ncbi:MAG: chorismate-binding protein [Cytophagaceae bacterium]|jgi:isochorismate synthase|nr:chorismate-binding protein [Cytophagaceae bacterium]
MQNTVNIQIQTRINNNSPFVIYRLPNEQHITLIDFADAQPFHFSFFDEPPTDSGFVVFPFDSRKEKGWWFSVKEVSNFEQCDAHKIHPSYAEEFPPVLQTEYEEYKNQFNEIQKEFVSGKLKKVILSRVINRQVNIMPQLSLLFSQMSIHHPSAFTYLLSTPETGIWAGVSPELLLKKEGDKCTTVSLAGTKHVSSIDSEAWSAKEFEEQGIVSDYIDRLLNDSGVCNYQKEGLSVVRAGTVMHLKTIYHFGLPPVSGCLSTFLHALHPTPALAGEPKQLAMNVIQKTETHNRRYYGGFLGAVSKQCMNLFVNIRCANIAHNHIHLYAGGGLTQRSNVDSEWHETELKAKTLLDIIRHIR